MSLIYSERERVYIDLLAFKKLSMEEYSNNGQALSTGEPEAGNPAAGADAADGGRDAHGNATVLRAGLIHKESTHPIQLSYWEEYLQQNDLGNQEGDQSQEGDGFLVYMARKIKRLPLSDLDATATRLAIGGAEAQAISNRVSPDPEVLQGLISLIEYRRWTLLKDIENDLYIAIGKAPDEATIQACLNIASQKPLTPEQIQDINKSAQRRREWLEESSEPEGGVYTREVLLAHVAKASSTERLTRIEELASEAYRKYTLTPNDLGTVIMAAQTKRAELKQESWQHREEYIVEMRIDKIEQEHSEYVLRDIMASARKSRRKGIISPEGFKAIENAYNRRVRTLHQLKLIREA
jgi:hypothetical protein